jgi:hypothetical protein
LFTKEGSSVPSSQKQNFSFGFVPVEEEESCPINREKHENISKKEEMADEYVLKETQMGPKEVTESSRILKKRVGLSFTNEEINDRLEKFYSANEGMAGLSAIMGNPKLAEEDNRKWEEERKTLTLDWKRKHKQAKTVKKNKTR